MDLASRSRIRDFIEGLLRNKDDYREFTNGESIFVSGRLDSLSAVELVGFLEESFGLDFSETDFEIERIDSVEAIELLIGENQRA